LLAEGSISIRSITIKDKALEIKKESSRHLDAHDWTIGPGTGKWQGKNPWSRQIRQTSWEGDQVV